MKPRVLIDAANLEHGGAVQVASSFLDELASLKADAATHAQFPWLADVDVSASPAVASNLLPETRQWLEYTQELRRPNQSRVWLQRPTHNVSFTVFGPAYGRPRADRQIVGFADGTSLFELPSNLIPTKGTAAARANLRKVVSRSLFRHVDRLVVEAEHVRKALTAHWGIPDGRIDVVPNCVNSVFHQTKEPSRNRSGWLFVTRNYPHKNLTLLGRIGEELRMRGVSDVQFTLTLTADEWAALDPQTQKWSTNIGPQRIEDLPQLYADSEGAVFPSLLESFSATPLEAISTSTPLVASNRSFVREVVHDSALYADPYSPEEWATAILRLRTDDILRKKQIARGLNISRSSPSAGDRACQYLAIINRELAALEL